MSYYENMAAQLQSRMAVRANKITEQIMWAEGYKALQRRKDWKETKKGLVKLHRDQKLDRDLLKLVHTSMREDVYGAYFEDMFQGNSVIHLSASRPAGD